MLLERKIEHTSEFYLQMITKKKLFSKIVEEIEKVHTYETCGVLMYDIVQGNIEFLKWIDEETK